MEAVALFFTSVIVSCFLRAYNQVCKRTLSAGGDSRCQGYTKTVAFFLLRSYTMSTPSSRSAGNGTGGERFDVPGDLGRISMIQHQFPVISRQMGILPHALQIMSGNERRRPRTPLLCKQPRKPK